MPVSVIQIVLNSEITLPKVLFGIDVCSVQLMCETLQPVWQQMVALFWSQTKQTSQMNTLQAFFPFYTRLSHTEKLLRVNSFSAAVTCLKGSILCSRCLFHCDCYYQRWDKGPSVVQLWSDSSSCGPAALIGVGHFENVPVTLPEIKGTHQQ